jgi:hypothetical protein
MPATAQISRSLVKPPLTDDALMKLVMDKVFREYNGSLRDYWEAIRPRVSSERHEGEVVAVTSGNVPHRSRRK